MSKLSLGERLVMNGWCIAVLLGESKIIFAKGKDRTIYDCGTDKIIKTCQAKEDWDPKQEPTQVKDLKPGGLEKIIASIEAEGLEKLLV